MIKDVPLAKIVANPFRDLPHYPIDETKVELLVGSYERTGFWENIVGRQKNGVVEIGYGHHRRIAYSRKYGKSAKMPVNIKQLDDEAMLKMMADENMHEWGTSAEIEQATIRAVVEAYAAGKIELKKPKNIAHNVKGWRVAPSFQQVSSKGFDFKDNKIKFYNAESIASFLGKKGMKPWWSGDQVSPRVRNALLALEAAEQLDAEEDIAEMTKGLSSAQAKEAVRTTTVANKEYQDAGDSPAVAKKKAVRLGKKVAKGLKDKKGIRKTGQAERRKVRKETAASKAKLPQLEQVVEDLIGLLNESLTRDKTKNIIDSLMEMKEYIDDKQKARLLKALQGLSNRADAFAKRLDSKSVGSKVYLLEEK
jgi:ParB-like chromosome segregation protein Spo0J